VIAKYLLKLSPEITQKTHVSESGASGALVGKNYSIVQFNSLTVFGKILKKKRISSTKNRPMYSLKKEKKKQCTS